jgi:hypothetical protein
MLIETSQSGVSYSKKMEDFNPNNLKVPIHPTDWYASSIRLTLYR